VILILAGPKAAVSLYFSFKSKWFDLDLTQNTANSVASHILARRCPTSYTKVVRSWGNFATIHSTAVLRTTADTSQDLHQYSTSRSNRLSTLGGIGVIVSNSAFFQFILAEPSDFGDLCSNPKVPIQV
jgi:hypothetical protein